MAYGRQFILTIAAVAIFLPSVALATDYIVGDEAGWTINFDYFYWARLKEFRVGDRLIFKYPAGAHNVNDVSSSAFRSCVVPPRAEVLSSGYDVVTLTEAGHKFFICGVGEHCKLGGQKLAISVQPTGYFPFPGWGLTPAPAPSTSSDVSDGYFSPAPTPSANSDVSEGYFPGWGETPAPSPAFEIFPIPGWGETPAPSPSSSSDVSKGYIPFPWFGVPAPAPSTNSDVSKGYIPFPWFGVPAPAPSTNSEVSKSYFPPIPWFGVPAPAPSTNSEVSKPYFPPFPWFGVPAPAPSVV